MTTYVVGDTDEGNLTVTPGSAAVDVGDETTFTFEWSGLDAGSSHLGWVGYRKAGDTVGLTLVSVG